MVSYTKTKCHKGAMPGVQARSGLLPKCPPSTFYLLNNNLVSPLIFS